MLWLLWIVLMLLIPISAGVRVWWELARTPVDTAPTAPESGQVVS